MAVFREGTADNRGIIMILISFLLLNINSVFAASGSFLFISIHMVTMILISWYLSKSILLLIIIVEDAGNNENGKPYS